MIDETGMDWNSMSDHALIKQIGAYVKKKRLEINKTQAQIARDAGINRWTLSQLEKGEAVTLSTFIQIMRVMDLLDFMTNFVIEDKISPITYAKLKEKERKRARNKNTETLSDEDLGW